MYRPSTARRAAATRVRVNELPVCDLPLVFSSLLVLPATDSFASIYSPVRTFWLFLHQVLTPGTPCKEVVHKALAWLWRERREIASSNNSGYCQARGRLDLNWILDLTRSLVLRLEEPANFLSAWGRRLLVVDGSSISMPDTPENQRRWPQPKNQKAGCGFPVMRFVALFSLATGALVETVSGPLERGEQSLWRMLWGRLRRGDIVLADRGFSSFAEFWLLSRRGIDMVARKNASRTSGSRRIKRLGREDFLVEWRRDKNCPQWLCWEWRKELPTAMIVREISYRVVVPGFRSESVTVTTTLTDPEAFPRADFIELYRRRWDAELWLRALKSTMGMEKLTCLSPDMIEKEFAMHWLAYNLIRGLMIQAAVEHGRDPARLSFKSSMDLIRQWAPEMSRVRSREELADLHQCILYYLAEQKLPSRPNRTEPRAIKRRPKPYPRLQQPRNQAKDTACRNHSKTGNVSPVLSTT